MRPPTSALEGPWRHRDGAETDFILNGYDGQKPLSADSIAQINNNCIEATFTDDFENDLVAYSHGTVLEGAVEADEGGGENFTDSTALNGSNSNNGTRGFTTGPDLAVRAGARLAEPDRLRLRPGGRPSTGR